MDGSQNAFVIDATETVGTICDVHVVVDVPDLQVKFCSKYYTGYLCISNRRRRHYGCTSDFVVITYRSVQVVIYVTYS